MYTFPPDGGFVRLQPQWVNIGADVVQPLRGEEEFFGWRDAYRGGLDALSAREVALPLPPRTEFAPLLGYAYRQLVQYPYRSEDETFGVRDAYREGLGALSGLDVVQTQQGRTLEDLTWGAYRYLLPAAVVGVDPGMVAQVAQSAQNAGVPLPAGMAEDLTKAASIIGAASVVPGVGTVGGAIVALGVTLGPKLLKGIGSLFAGKTNPWPPRIRKLETSQQPPAVRMQALWSAMQLADYQTRSTDQKDTARWARSAVTRLRGLMEQTIRQLPPAEQERWVKGPPGLAQFRALPLVQLQAFVAHQEMVLATPGMIPPTASRAAITAQLQAARQALRERTAPAPAAPTTREQWQAWIVAAYNAQVRRLPVPPPPPIPQWQWPPLPPEWVQWLQLATHLQQQGQPVPFPPAVDPRWVGA